MAQRPYMLLVHTSDTDKPLTLLATNLKAAGYAVLTAQPTETTFAELAQPPSAFIFADAIQTSPLFLQLQRRWPTVPMIIHTIKHVSFYTDATETAARWKLPHPTTKTALLNAVKALFVSVQHRQDNAWRSAIISRDAPMTALLDRAYRIAKQDCSIVITGPCGSGKVMLAKAIHKASLRASDPFIVQDCRLLASAYALHASPERFSFGKLFDAVEGGTLCLQYIDEMPIILQAHLYQYLQQHTYQSHETGSTHLRIIATSQNNLEHALLAGAFHEALYDQLHRSHLILPPLYERAQDIPLLARYFLSTATKPQRKRRNLSSGAMHLLVQATWPGNIRQLQEVIHNIARNHSNPLISEAIVAAALSDQTLALPPFNEARTDFERHYLIQLMQLTEGNMTYAARIAQRNRTDLYKLINKHGIEPKLYKARHRITPPIKT